MAVETHDVSTPYLSVVVTSRNDGHGGDPLVRLQAFVNTFDAQCRRFGLDAELIVVEWNPPADRPRLHEVINVPPDCAFTVRYIEVPPGLHKRLPRAHVLPLFQMIGKNAGVRRARGRFVLCTNIDIIFSNELVEFFASRAFRPGVMYRVDRHDIESDYPIDVRLEEQMRYCSRHQLRIHRSSGTYPVDSDGRLVPLTSDVFDPPSVTIGDGWHMREGEPSLGHYRWATDQASVIVNGAIREGDAGTALALEIEPNPYDSASWVELEILDSSGVLVRTRISDRQMLWVPLSDERPTREIVLKTVGAPESAERSLPAFERRAQLFYRLRSARLARLPVSLGRLSRYDMNGWQNANAEVVTESSPEGIAVRSPHGQYAYCLRYGPLYAPRGGGYTFVVDCTSLEGNLALHVVDELADCWIPSEQFEMADGDRRRLFVTLQIKRGQPFSLFVANHRRGGDGASRFVLHAISGSVPFSELEDARSFARTAQRIAAKAARGAARRARRLLVPAKRSAGGERPHESIGKNPVSQPRANAPDSNTLTARIEEYARKHRLAPVHRNAAGDFQLMARDHWFELHGYAELTMYSMNVDGLLGDVAHHAGMSEEILSPPRCIYHLEHETGSGWTPEGEGLLRKRLADSGADWLDATTVDLWSAYMDWLKRPMIFNGSDWGLGGAVLHETTVQAVAGKR